MNLEDRNFFHIDVFELIKSQGSKVLFDKQRSYDIKRLRKKADYKQI